jgi:hypothetical protein
MPGLNLVSMARSIFPKALPALEEHTVAAEKHEAGELATKLAADHLALSPGSQMVADARKLLAGLSDNAYAHTPEIAPEKGIFHADCSDLINWLTGHENPAALKEVPVEVGQELPRARDYYDYFRTQPATTAKGDWARVGKPRELAPGDVIAWKNEQYVPGKSSTGHVMMVTELPKAVTKAGQVVGYDVPIIDSTSHGHGLGDTRPTGHSGLGEGTIYLPVDGQGQTSGFSWTSSGSPGDPPRPATIAYGRLLHGVHQK